MLIFFSPADDGCLTGFVDRSEGKRYEWKAI